MKLILYFSSEETKVLEINQFSVIVQRGSGHTISETRL